MSLPTMFVRTVAGVDRGGGLPHPLSYLMGGAHGGAHVV